jgi:hypothetical protein
MGHEDQLPPPRLVAAVSSVKLPSPGSAAKKKIRRKQPLVSKRCAAINPKFDGFITGSSLSRF